MIETTPAFTCPRCGGHHFGSVTARASDGTVQVVGQECHNMTDGRPPDGAMRIIEGRWQNRPDSLPPCGWRGTAE